jgi:hypothetical protein
MLTNRNASKVAMRATLLHAAARAAEARGEGVRTFRLFPDSAELAREAGGRHGVEGYEYY